MYSKTHTCSTLNFPDLSSLHYSYSAEAPLSQLKMYSFMGGGLFCAIVGNILLVVSTATDYWMQYRLSGNYAHQGLWRYCMSNKCYMQTDSIGKTLRGSFKPLWDNQDNSQDNLSYVSIIETWLKLEVGCPVLTQVWWCCCVVAVAEARAEQTLNSYLQFHSLYFLTPADKTQLFLKCGDCYLPLCCGSVILISQLDCVLHAKFWMDLGGIHFACWVAKCRTGLKKIKTTNGQFKW